MRKRILPLLLSLALCLSLLPTAALAADNVLYIGASGENLTQNNVTEVTTDTTTWSGGWYVVNGNVTVSTRITVTGEAHLILADGATLEASAGITIAQGNSLTVYGQSEGTGTLTATGGYQQAGIGGDVGGNGDYAPSGAITINGGMITAQGGAQAAGIGGGYHRPGGVITINGGVIKATGGDADGGGGAGIGCGKYQAGGSIIINGGVVTAQGGTSAAGIGRSFLSGSGNATFSTGENGSAVIIASSISDWSNRDFWRGVIFENNSGQVYGDSVTPTEDFTIPSGKELTVPKGTMLTIPEGVTLTISSGTTVTLENEGTIINNGTIINSGTITGDGSLTGEGTVTNNGKISVSDNDFMATVKVSVSPSPATYNSNVTLMATVTNGDSSVSGGSVTFYQGEVKDSNKLNSEPANVTSGTATASIQLTGNDWTPNETPYTITAVYTPAEDSKLLESTGTTTLTVKKAPGSIEIACDSVTYDEAVQPSVTNTTNEGAEVTYSYVGTGGTNYPASTTAPSVPGTYTVTATVAETATHTLATSEPVAFTIHKAGQAAPATGDGYTIDYPNETIQADAAYELAAAAGDAGASELTVIPGTDMYIRFAETSTHNASDWTLVDVPARPAAPDVTGGVERIQGATTAMEYRTGDGAWTRFTQATVGRLDPGTYAVRLAATASAFASASVTVEVTQYTPPANPNYWVDIPTPENGTVTADPAAAKAGETVTLTPTPDAGYEVGEITVTDRFGNTVEVTENPDSTYTFTMPSGQVSVEVTFVEVQPEPLPFTDVAEGDWFHDAVQYVYDNGLMNGVENNQFAPNATTNRAMVVTILYRLAGEPAVSGDVGFTDVADGLWYSNAVLWAAQKGIVNGISETEFAPSGDLTREQLATILYRYAEGMGCDVSASADLSGFPDAGDIQPYATQVLSWAVAEGLLQGFEDDSLQPGGTATRAQIATILMRFCETVAK